MKILLVTSHFHPENFKANDMAFDLARRGHDVTVLTPIPDYPIGRYYDGYGIFRRRSERINGVRVIRTLITPRRNGSSSWLTLNYLTYTVFATLRAIRLGITRRFDAILVHETSPVTVGIPAVLVKKMQRIPMYFWALDLWPESLDAAGEVHSRYVLGIFRSLTAWIYRNSERILISSKGFRKSIGAMGDFNNRIEFFPNWVDETLSSKTDVEVPELPAGFNVMFAGNIGDAQDMPHLLDAARRLRNDGINIILIGDGRKKEWVEQQIAEHGHTNVYLLGRYPLSAMPSLFAKTDVLFLSLKNNPIFSLTVPAKLQAYMSAGKPIVGMINGEGADTIADADCGWTVPAEDSETLANVLRHVATMPATDLAAKGLNGLNYCHTHYDFAKCMAHLDSILRDNSLSVNTLHIGGVKSTIAFTTTTLLHNLTSAVSAIAETADFVFHYRNISLKNEEKISYGI